MLFFFLVLYYYFSEFQKEAEIINICVFIVVLFLLETSILLSKNETSDYLNHPNYISNCISVVESHSPPIFCNVFILLLEYFNCISFDFSGSCSGKATNKYMYKKHHKAVPHRIFIIPDIGNT